MLKKTKIINTQAPLSRVQDNLASTLDTITSIEMLDGVRIENIKLLSGIDNLISHKLNRIPLGYIILRKRASSDIWDTQDSNKSPSKTLILNCSANVTIDIWIF
jgi:hypothetical protein